MTWYGVHVVMAVKFKDGCQDTHPVWENIYLVQASDHDEARKKGEALGVQEEGDSLGTFHWNERPAEWVFSGIKKLWKSQIAVQRRMT